jgi:hypothetical protein
MITFIVTSQFNSYYFHKFEIEKLIDLGHEVQVICLDTVLHKKIQQTENINFDNLHLYNAKNLFGFFKYLIFLQNNNPIHLVINFVQNTTFKGTLINFFLKLKKIKYFYILNHGHAIPEKNLINLTKSNFLEKFYSAYQKIINREFKYIYNRIFIKVFLFIEKVFLLKPDKYLIAGEEHIKAYSYLGDNLIVPFNSYDYSNYLSNKDVQRIKEKDSKRLICYIDGAGPAFTGDDSILGKKNILTSKKWYPSLCKFFDSLERKLNATVIVCGHPQSSFGKYPSEFGGREVIYNQTSEIIEQSILVISRGSTAMSYALINKIPILGIFSNEMLQWMKHKRGIHYTFEAIDCDIINIDDYNLDNINLLDLDEAKYENFINKFLRSSSNPNSKLNYEIISDLFYKT